MEAAFTLSLRGHEVHLYEKENALGGQLRLACVPPGKGEVRLLTAHLSGQLKKAGVNIHLGTPVDEKVIDEEAPDAMVLAAGAIPWRPCIEGIDGANVVLPEDVLLGRVALGDRIAIIGGELVGCEVAHYIASQKKAEIFVMRRHEEMATKVEPLTRIILMRELQSKGVTLMPCVEYKKITPEGVDIFHTKDCREDFVKADTVVVATGTVPNTALVEMADGKTKEQLYIIGDNLAPRTIKAAIEEGAHVGRQI